MAEVTTLPRDKPDVQITLTWGEAGDFGQYLGMNEYHPVAKEVVRGIDAIRSSFEED